jgi:putative intracellular protease/amidase
MTTRTVHLAIYDTLADWEYGYAAAGINNPMFQKEPGRYQIRTVALTTAPVITAGGVRMLPDLAIADLDPSDSAMLILPGGDGWMTGGLAAFGELARKFLEADVPVAGICGATYGLAQAGVLDDRDHTSNVIEQLGGYGGADRYKSERVVRDRHLITAGGTGALEFAREIFAELDLYEPQVLEAWYGLYRTGDAAWFEKLVRSVEE